MVLKVKDLYHLFNYTAANLNNMQDILRLLTHCGELRSNWSPQWNACQ